MIMNSCPIVHRYHNGIHIMGEEMLVVDVDTKIHEDILDIMYGKEEKKKIFRLVRGMKC